MKLKRVSVFLSVVMLGAGVVSAQTVWVDSPDNPVLGPGEPGAWNSAGQSVGTVLFDGELYHAWLAGRNADGNSDIGHATSSDGIQWTMDPANPVLARGADGDWDDDWLFAPTVIYDGSEFHMWYSANDGNVEQTGYATSPDGTIWAKHAGNPVLRVAPSGTGDDRAVRVGTVLLEDGTYRMWFYGASTTNGHRIRHAESIDGTDWDIHPDPVLVPSEVPGSWEHNIVANPTVVFDGSAYHMWYPAGLDRQPPNGRVYIGYAFSSDGKHWTKHRGNPVIRTADNFAFNSAVIFDGSAWHMWYSHSDGASDWVSNATSGDGSFDPALDNVRYLPAAAYAAGAVGSFYETDLDLSNADDQPVEYELWWLPRGGDNSEPTISETFTLGAGMSVRYANVLAEVFELEPDSFGALALLSTSPDLMAMARIANIPQDTGDGSFGQAIPSLTSDDFTGVRERRRLLFGTENSDMRFNVGCLNIDTTPARVDFELVRSDGTLLGSESLILLPFDNNQLNRIFDPYHPVTGHVDYWSAATSGRIWCFGSVLDNVTSDPTTVPPQ